MPHFECGDFNHSTTSPAAGTYAHGGAQMQNADSLQREWMLDETAAHPLCDVAAPCKSCDGLYDCHVRGKGLAKTVMTDARVSAITGHP
jgi:hypothetical protein